MSDAVLPKRSVFRVAFRRGPWENAASVVIGVGILMMTQPFSLDLYSYSFATILGGTAAFVIVSHFRD